MPKNIACIFVVIFCIYLLGFGIDVMEVDAAQYASMSREMLERGNFLQVYDLGQDYLDKPPFLFWISALSMKFFGVNNFAYRLPSFLFSLLAIYSVFKLCSLYYNKTISILAAMILATCQGVFLINHDVRTDTVLMGWVIFSLWQLAAWYQNNKLYHFFLGCAGIAGGLLTKGPIALFVPVFAFGTHFILQRNFKMFFRWQYLAGIVLIGILILPMCVGLYQQFDLHPEKMVNGKSNVSGLRFFFWTQSLGRITGESVWDNNSDIFFLLQNMLWAFLPWILFFVIALFLDIKQLVVQKFKLSQHQEWISTGGFILTYFSLGLSKYQLPHYIFVVFPLAAIITAKFIYTLVYENKYPKFNRILTTAHFVLFALLWASLLFLLFYCFNTIPVYIPMLAALAFAAFVFLFFYKKTAVHRLLIICVFTIAGINLFLNISVYPSLLQYQMGSMVGKWINEKKIPADKIFIFQYPETRALHFYAKAIIQHKDSLAQVAPGDRLILYEHDLPLLTAAGKSYEIEYRGEDFHISMLSLNFLNPATRKNEVQPYVVAKIK